ncbi:HpcH/HpaI aldolase/citrate lyase family protein [Gordonia aquimaris]|uniref:Aldolase/citrate lyase family protein n=1 Tax=Gordonia aquimaris TaxID=2984863 RepID=A0A9X3D1K6_9ACTN|nr:aldolase/citrate lyase family protein [Gordonia aquimaris]MCX2963215.1 aldolase/citrate lyase family protein [Gordonia aquimaris]
MREHRDNEWRSLLYVPANRDRYLRSAASSAADAVILDLEDAVPAGLKAQARSTLAEAVATLRNGTATVMVRVNRSWTLMIDDLAAAVAAGVDAVVVPKSDDPSVIRTVDEALTDMEAGTAPVAVIPLIESVRGVRRVDAIVAAADRVIAASTGIGDLCMDLGAAPDSPAVVQAFNEVIGATRASGRTPLGLAGLIVSFQDQEAFRDLALLSKAIGSRGGSCIHPSQVDVLNDVFSPTPAELKHAQRLVDGYEQAAADGHGTAVLDDGTFVDNANYQHARRLLRRRA